MTIDEIRDVYDALVNQTCEVTLKGKTMHYTAINGNMFSFVSKGGEVGFRLSAEEKEFYIQHEGASIMMQHNRVMNGYIHVSDVMLSDPSKLKEIFTKSILYANTLKPKATKKKA